MAKGTTKIPGSTITPAQPVNPGKGAPASKGGKTVGTTINPAQPVNPTKGSKG